MLAAPKTARPNTPWKRSVTCASNAHQHEPSARTVNHTCTHFPTSEKADGRHVALTYLACIWMGDPPVTRFGSAHMGRRGCAHKTPGHLFPLASCRRAFRRTRTELTRGSTLFGLGVSGIGRRHRAHFRCCQSNGSASQNEVCCAPFLSNIFIEMEAHLTQVLSGIARCMARNGVEKALSFEAVRLASQERVQQRPHPERRFGEQHETFEVTKISSEDRTLQRTGDQTFAPRTRYNSLWLCGRRWSRWRKSRRQCPGAARILSSRSEFL